MRHLGLGALPDAEWEGDCIFSNEDYHFSSLIGEDDGNIDSMFYSLDSHSSILQHISQERSDNSNSSDHTVFMANPGHRDSDYNFSYLDDVLANSTTSTSINFCMVDEKRQPRSFVKSHTDIVMEENVSMKLKKRILDESELKDKINSNGNPKKKPCVSNDAQGCMKDARSKKNQKVKESEETNGGSDGHSSNSYTSEEDNASVSKSPVTLSSNGKNRASRGSATDPQSLYARKRREKINERLKTLQNLVPNGTKVDISTMLEDAVNYVKFLQLQIKLLSSDDLWMYAPIAYNGLDIGLNLIHKNSPPT